MTTPFDENPIGSRYRERYGKYRSRYSRGRKADATSCTYVTMAGFTWVKMNIWSFGNDMSNPKHASTRVNNMIIDNSNPWIGTPQVYLMINGVKIYPTTPYLSATLGVTVLLTWDYVTVRPGEDLEMWVRSTDPTDGIMNNANACGRIGGIVEMEDYTSYFI